MISPCADRVVFGIDVTLNFLKGYILPDGEEFQLTNNTEGRRLLKEHFKRRMPSVILLQSGGKAPRLLAAMLAEERLPVVMVSPGEVKAFLKQSELHSQTDLSTTEALARYALENNPQPQLLGSEQLLTLNELITRQGQLMNLRTMELNRRDRVKSFYIQISHDLLLDSIVAQLHEIEEQISNLIKSSPISKIRDKQLLASAPEGDSRARTLSN